MDEIREIHDPEKGSATGLTHHAATSDTLDPQTGATVDDASTTTPSGRIQFPQRRHELPIKKRPLSPPPRPPPTLPPSPLLADLNAMWARGHGPDIKEVANRLRWELTYTRCEESCRALTWDMHLIVHKDDPSPCKEGPNRFARIPSTDPIVKRRVGDALA